MKSIKTLLPRPNPTGGVFLLVFGVLVAAAAPLSGQERWKSFGGPTAEFYVDYLPESLPENPERLWEVPVRGQSYGPISADEKRVVIPDAGAGQDFYYVIDRETGEELWYHSIENRGDMDYGSAPRVRPLMEFGKLYVLNAWGILHAVDLETGELVWERNLPEEFEAEVPIWGYCSSMHFIEEGLVVNPGGAKGGLVCLDPADGSLVWAAPSDMAEYASHLVTEVDGVRQVIAYDATSLFATRAEDGEVLWRVPMSASSGYICPAPVKTGKGLILVDQDNGARLYPLKDGKPVEEEKIVADSIYAELNTPFVIGDKVYFFFYGLLTADKDSLEILDEFYESEPMAGSSMGYPFVDKENQRAMIYTKSGHLTLLDLSGDSPVILSEIKIAEEGEIVPALVDGIIYARDDTMGAYAYRLWDDPE